MKKRFLLKCLALLSTGALTLSCQPDTDDLLKGQEDVYSGIYMPQAISKPAKYTFTVSNQPETIIYGANYGGPTPLGQDLPVQFSANAALVAPYNSTNFTDYPLLPENSYTLEQSSSVIPAKGQGTPPLRLQIHTDKLGGVGGYLLPVSVAVQDGTGRIKEELSTTYFLINANYETNPFTDLDRSAWQVTAFSSDENENASGGRVRHALDNNLNTFWTTSWRTTKPGPPHFITVDMGSAQKINGLKILGRLANGEPRSTGNPRDIVVQTSQDGSNWTFSQPFSLQNLAESTLYLNYAQTARYFKITINSSQGDNYLTHIVEVKAF